MFVDELRKLSDKSESNKKKVEALITHAKEHAKWMALSGNKTAKIFYTNKNWDKEHAELAAIELRKEGLICVLEAEITNQYSNTDWDQEEVLTLKW